jgi:DNA processing protein
MARRIELGDADYPGGLRELEHPPQGLYVEGELPPLEHAVAIVGTRRVDAGGMRFARELASELARAGCTIVSGGAHGIDTAAHEGTLDVGGATVAVLPSRVDVPYPPRNRDMFASIASTGALVSEHALDPVRFKSEFLARNRLIAALARVTVVVQAPVPSGALSTAVHARKLGRVVMAVPFSPWEVRGAGCLALLASGALMLRSSDDVLAQIAPDRLPVTEPRRAASRARFADEDQQAVHEALVLGPRASDALCDATRLPSPRVQRALLLLLLAGDIEDLGAGRYTLSRRRAGP